jgi:hypothetical protein
VQSWTLGPPAKYDQLLAKREVLGDEVGFLGENSPDDGPNDPEKEYRHLSKTQESESVPEYTRAGSNVRI